MGDLRLYLRLLGASVRCQMQYRVSFVLMSIGHGIVTAAELLGMWVLFERFGSLRSWRLAEVAMFYALVNVSFSFGDAFGRGFDTFDRMVRSGDFDRVLLRPRGSVLQVAGSELRLMRAGRLAQALIVMVLAGAALEVRWDPARVALVVLTIVGGACFFMALFVAQATVSFWSTQSLEVMNCFTYGGVAAAKYPLAIYRPWFRRVFTFLVPLACVSWFPGLLILGRTDMLGGAPAWLAAAAPMVGVLALVLALQVWRIGVRHYRSTGS